MGFSTFSIYIRNSEISKFQSLEGIFGFFNTRKDGRILIHIGFNP
ncbi:hypothetical protein CKA32_000684 [Geitlerinema sp. FC II]|nr:hypothetical protein CKA32_000684 [Geitlerinema sp. FC II]